MEMTYDGMLVMPSSYAVMDEKEMMYVEGGGIKTLKNNLYGIYNIVINYMCKYLSYATVGRVLANAGLSWDKIGQMSGSYWRLAGKIVSIVKSVTTWLGTHATIIGITAGVGASILLWNVRMFY